MDNASAVEEYSFARFKRDGYPATTWTELAVVITTYLVVIYGIREFMKDRKRFELNWLVAIHNFFLSALSLVMFCGVSYHVFYIWLTSTDAWNDLLCDSKHRLVNTPYNLWTYVFYLSKFYELFDTVIIVLKKRPLIFLHVYHHIITMVLVYVMMDDLVAVRWLPTIANCAVHVPMYYYYAMSAMGVSLWWKKYVTKMQILQFVIDVVGINAGAYYYLSGTKCSSSTESWLFGQAIIFSFLVLFINFYRKTYNRERPSNSGEASATESPTQSRSRKPRKDE